MSADKQISDFVYFCSPLIPCEGKEYVIQHAVDLYKTIPLPALCLSIAIAPLFTVRMITLRNTPGLLSDLGLTIKDLNTINIGYKFPLETIQLSEITKGTSETEYDNLFEEFANTTHNFKILLAQESIKQNLRATTNLQTHFPSGDQTFDYLKRYPHDKSLMFAVGMEIAAIVYWNLVPEFDKLINNDWLTLYDKPN